jgi:hypothetical protein
MKTIWTSVLGAALIFASAVVTAQNAPLEVPNAYGQVTDVRNGEMVVADQLFVISDGVEVTDEKGFPGLLERVRPGQTVMVFSVDSPTPGGVPLAKRIVLTGE